jgi:hypothetical protein
MKNARKTFLATAAISGLLSGIQLHQARGAETNAPAAGQQAVAAIPKIHACSGVNDCKGTGGCKTAEHSCKFLNSCKGKGGCEITAEDIKTWEKQQKAAKEKPASGAKATNSI